jgi:hypothetical protein
VLFEDAGEDPSLLNSDIVLEEVHGRYCPHVGDGIIQGDNTYKWLRRRQVLLLQLLEAKQGATYRKHHTFHRRTR